MKRWGALLLFLALAVLFLSGCGKKTDIGLLQSRAAQSGLLPAGCWYTGEKQPWEEGYLSPTLLASFLGCEEWETERFAVFLSASDRELAEIALVCCYTEKESARVASLCAARLAFLRKNASALFPAALEDAFVRVEGRTVIYSAAPVNRLLRAE